MKERGSDREKGSAKSCQPEIKQAGTLPIPKPLHPPQSHILPLHSLYLSASLLPSSISPIFFPLPLQRDIFKPRPYSGLAPWSCRTFRHTCVIRHAFHQTCPRTAEALWTALLRPNLGSHDAFVCRCTALEENSTLGEQYTGVVGESCYANTYSVLRYLAQKWTLFSQFYFILFFFAALSHLISSQNRADGMTQSMQART